MASACGWGPRGRRFKSCHPDKMTKFISFTIELNGIDYLEKTFNYLRSVRTNPQDWKWIFISLHGAIYSFAIAVASGTSDTSVIGQSGKIIGIWKALKKCVAMGKLSKEDVSSKDFQEFISEFRNGFAHPKPGTWSIGASGLPRMTSSAFSVVKKLASSHSHFHYESGEKERLEESLAGIEEQLDSFN